MSISPMASAPDEHVVTTEDLLEGPRAKQWVQVAARVFPELGTVSKAKRARKAGHLLLNGQAHVPTLVCAGVTDVLAYSSPEKQSQSVADRGTSDPEALAWLKVCKTQGLRIVYEGDKFAVVVKPVGIHVKGRGKRSVERALPMLLQRQQAVSNGDFELAVPHAVHRLDYRVGGLLLVAKTRRMEVELSTQLERHSVTKQYRAILVGNISEKILGSRGSCALLEPMGLPKALQEIRDELYFVDGPIDGRLCVTALRVVSTTRSVRYGWLSTVDLWPLTGRKHQLRIHTARYGHPIVGDDLYHDACSEEHEEIDQTGDNSVQHQPAVVRGMGLFLFSVGVAFEDAVGNRRSFRIDEPHKFTRFRHYCDLNWTRQAARQDQ
ncbi:hypothetical protein KRP22_012040 [Phytophthora ramorum]|uniref:Ribosomal large subunit pseudouridine synthase C n=1 Tax=Phytophthora ramorum TaxID=164328 RepID=UPI0030AC3C65|nr:Ribosomal large subunit pseudouridine synthase C [Phytophthora ramorum]KAH7498738.1 Ribosomal large subunit pseudouridine synthase C [Phytophthora ramorum]